MTTPAPRPSEGPDALSLVVVSLLKGVVYREDNSALWQSLLQLQARVRDQVSVLGMRLMLDESEGHAFLRQRSEGEGASELPRLIARRQLGYGLSLLLALLRKKLADADAAAGGGRLVLRRHELQELVRLFLPDGTNEVRWVERVNQDIERALEMGFLRRLGEEDTFEVRRILKAFVDAQWLEDFEQRLAAYRDQLVEKQPGGVE
ncbi:DUF4194 domain-containing protein [Myxococcus llanfairpwllgwyngyllgogerychwyrndrobwllllantysiliogogogochensis]|uniref:DUF4194 domain-containing protein n=1 Tax=Myxococcus llanfairpwllgwyngyllgogerychwyrndrobwllllantysiliogogogochensis TaxID=2590453 RepID=A0A540WWX9_9BACT|nr:DUF4194 domain-containing protein [Myxococcus llanfairpwllgwyngyllgogerychwyrndrobwllllantysiliogogogochensis]TQF13521.1 DUF4194 domain-containing protein [Myxococcus llanfairpwllgwyngyllgogerychwyrndrobwllllantysiliogogogochensis]